MAPGSFRKYGFCEFSCKIFDIFLKCHQSYHYISSRLVFLPKLSRQTQGESEGDGPGHEDRVERPQGGLGKFSVFMAAGKKI